MTKEVLRAVDEFTETNLNKKGLYHYNDMQDAFLLGYLKCKKNLWKPADGDDLPEIDKDVIVLIGIAGDVTTKSLFGYEVCFAHRPNPEGWEGKSIATGDVEHYTPKTYGEGGWNIPGVKWWLDICLFLN